MDTRLRIGAEITLCSYEAKEIDRIIMDELVPGAVNPEVVPKAVSYFQKVFERMKEEGCDAVILGCTEIPLIVNDSVSPLPTLDSTRLLARAALRKAVHEEDPARKALRSAAQA